MLNIKIITYFCIGIPEFISFMSVIFILIIIGVVVAGGFLVAFIWAVKSGQYEDSYSPSVRVLFDDYVKKEETSNNNNKTKKPKNNNETKKTDENEKTDKSDKPVQS